MKIEILSKGKSIDIQLNDTLFIPDLRRLILSVAKIIDRGFKVSFARNLVTDRGERKLFTAKRFGDLYYIAGKVQRDAKLISQPPLWVLLLGHINMRDITEYIRKEAIQGIKLTFCLSSLSAGKAIQIAVS